LVRLLDTSSKGDMVVGTNRIGRMDRNVLHKASRVAEVATT